MLEQNKWKCKNMWGTFEWKKETQGISFYINDEKVDFTKYTDINKIEDAIDHYVYINSRLGLFPADTDTKMALDVYWWMKENYQKLKGEIK